jgi:hypothetical protein
MPRSTLVTPDIEYPDSDGLPMAETEFQFHLDAPGRKRGATRS